VTHILHKYRLSPPTLKLFIFVGIVWAAVVGPFSSVIILKSMDATSAQIGVFTALGAVISMVFQPVWGLVSDKIGSPRKVLCMCLGASAFFFGCVYFTDNFYIAAGLIIVDIIFRCGVISLLDSHTIQEINKIPGLQYSNIRVAGSIFYGTLSLVYSGVIGNWGEKALIPISVCIAAVAIGWGMYAKGKYEKEKIKEENANKPKPNLKKEAVSLLRNKQYLIFIAFVSFCSLAVAPLFVFIIEYVISVGGNPGDVPKIHAMRCVVELPFFIFIGSVGKRFSAKKLMLAGMCFNCVYMVGLLFANSFFWLAACHLVGSPGFILGLTGRMRYINETTPESVRSTSITVMGACEIGLGSIIGNLIAGFVLGAFGTQAFTMVALVSLCIATLILTQIRPKPDTGQSGETQLEPR
jgi:PPP family 3-phenylpropionic acid transporter